MKIQIKTIYGSLTFEGDFSSMKGCVLAAIKSNADLCGADLCGANLRGADLRGADLRGANLCGADLCGADLCGANLRGANLCGADLRGANLCGADLCGANLRGANLCGANLRGANLCGADLRGADLRGANLCGAKNSELVIAMTRILPDGELIGWKKLFGGKICKLQIPSTAKRSHAFGRKCRASSAVVLEIWDGINSCNEGISNYDNNFVYEVGKTISPKEKFSDDWQDECASGIHFFITKIEAENYNP